jgi:tRNA (cmo5U34)-methyltransferase
MTLEEMGRFFNARLDWYERHVLQDIDGSEDYIQIAGLIPLSGNLRILDLGCGTGLELDEIFKVNPSVYVAGIDLAEKMLEKLKQKHAARENQLKLVLADYFNIDFGRGVFDVALAVRTLHHFSPEEKEGLYRRIHAALKPEGFYIEADNMAPNQEFEDFHFAEKKRIYAEQGLKEGRYHYDTPCTVENQVGLMQKAGFSRVEIVWQKRKLAIIKAGK